MNKIKIAPSILSGNFANMGESVENVNKWGADYVHCDVMDGSFVPNITFGMPMIKSIKKYSAIPLDVHLMIVNPEKYVEQFADCGADIISFHPNATVDVDNVINLIHSKNAKAGLVINPDVEVEIVKPYLNKIDMIVLMGVYPGFGGQKFIEPVLEKIRLASKMINECAKKIELELDGGVTEDNIDAILECGANVIIGGNAVFSSKNPAQTIIRLRGNN